MVEYLHSVQYAAFLAQFFFDPIEAILGESSPLPASSCPLQLWLAASSSLILRHPAMRPAELETVQSQVLGLVAVLAEEEVRGLVAAGPLLPVEAGHDEGST